MKTEFTPPPASQPPRYWIERLEGGQLTEAEYTTLYELVDWGEAASLEEAARLLDFRERETNLEATLEGA